MSGPPSVAPRSIRDRVDPDVLAGLDRFLGVVGPEGLSAIADIGERRRRFDELVALRTARHTPSAGVEKVDVTVPGAPGGPAVPVRVYRQTRASGSLPVLFYVHGGGMILGNRDADDLIAEPLAERLECVVAAVDYRLAPEHPHPAPVEDCYAALTHVVANPDDFDIDPDRLVVYGASAGGGLAAATMLLVRDRGGPRVRLQMLVNPMLDDRNETPSSHEVTNLGAWDRSANVEGWECLLDAEAGAAEVSPYAAPARANDLGGLPPAYIDVGELDVLRDECIEYAARLLRAGVATELHVHPGAIHGSEFWAPDSALAQRIVAGRVDALRRALQ